MPEVHFTNLLIVAAVAFAAPLALGFAPALRLPAVVLEIIAGIVIGPSGLGWVEIDLPVDILAILGLAFLLFLAGLEIDPTRIRGRTLRLTSVAFAPAILYRGAIGTRRAVVAGLLQATSLPFIVAATMIGQDLGLITEASSAALIAAGLLSVVIFPITGLALLRSESGVKSTGDPTPATPVLSAADRSLCRAAAAGSSMPSMGQASAA